MRSTPPMAMWTGGAFGAAILIVVIAAGLFGAGTKAIDVGLLATARLAFLFFWPAYAGGALTALFGTAFSPVKRRAKELGLAFASVEIVHLGLVAWLCLIGDAPSVSTFLFFGFAVLWTAMLALLSIDRMRRAFGPKSWWLVRVVGLNYIAYAFYADFARDPFGGGSRHMLEYLPFYLLAVAGPALRLIASFRQAAAQWRRRIQQIV